MGSDGYPSSTLISTKTRSQAVARIADRTALRHRSRDHLIVHMPFPIGGLLESRLYL